MLSMKEKIYTESSLFWNQSTIRHATSHCNQHTILDTLYHILIQPHKNVTYVKLFKLTEMLKMSHTCT